MKKYQILIVDDESDQRDLIEEFLLASTIEYDIKQACNGVEALKILKVEPIDAVLLDKRMPLMDGDELCRRIRADLKMDLLPIIMVTATNACDELSRSFAAGANDFIHKPYNRTELLARLGNAVANKRLTDQLDNADNLLFTLARLVEAKDTTTGDHCSRLMHMGVSFGKRLGLEDEEIDALRKGGILHDIGKLAIPDSILLKDGPLDEEEWEVMKNHAMIGAQLCEGLHSMKTVIPIILSHHERWDGSGYPYGLVGEEIPLLARIFQILDIYDALSSKRPYKEAFSTEQIITIFEQETNRGWRDPFLVKEFINFIETSSEELKITPDSLQSIDERIFESISASDIMNWGQEKIRVPQ